MELEKPTIKRKGRGLGRKLAMIHMSIRIPKHVVDYFDDHHPDDKQEKIREVLVDYVKSKEETR